VENPLSLQASLAFAQYVDKLELYQTAADAYEYAVQAFRYLYPAEPLPDYIYLPWALSNYNTLRNQHKCLQIASEFRQAGRFDLALETIAAKAAQKIGNIEQANLIFQYAEKKALENLKITKRSLTIAYYKLKIVNHSPGFILSPCTVRMKQLTGPIRRILSTLILQPPPPS
jgi:hypothetical protein